MIILRDFELVVAFETPPQGCRRICRLELAMGGVARVLCACARGCSSVRFRVYLGKLTKSRTPAFWATITGGLKSVVRHLRGHVRLAGEGVFTSTIDNAERSDVG